MIRTTVLAVAMIAGANNVAALEMCSGGNRAERGVTCLVDGDTGWERGVKWRLEGIDTPEYADHAECSAEPAIAKEATSRMKSLMTRGYEIEWLDEKGGMGRDLVRVRLSDGRYAGEVLVSEGLAVTWPHEPGVWCR